MATKNYNRNWQYGWCGNLSFGITIESGDEEGLWFVGRFGHRIWIFRLW